MSLPSYIEKAIERLHASCPVRVHYCGDDGLKKEDPEITRRRTANGNHRQPIIVRGRTYKSITHARKALKISIHKLYDWLDTGKARRG